MDSIEAVVGSVLGSVGGDDEQRKKKERKGKKQRTGKEKERDDDNDNDDGCYNIKRAVVAQPEPL